MGPRPRPTSWAVGLAPFGRTELTLASHLSGGAHFPRRRRTLTMATKTGRTAWEARIGTA